MWRLFCALVLVVCITGWSYGQQSISTPLRSPSAFTDVVFNVQGDRWAASNSAGDVTVLIQGHVKPLNFSGGLSEIDGVARSVSGLVFLLDGTTLVTTTVTPREDGTSVWKWDETRKFYKKTRTTQGAQQALAAGPKAAEVIMGGGGCVGIYDVDQGQYRSLFDQKGLGLCSGVAYSDEGRSLFAGYRMGNLMVKIDVDSHSAQPILQRGVVAALALSVDGRWLAIACLQGKDHGSAIVTVYDMSTQRAVNKLETSYGVNSLAFAGKYLVVAGGQQDTRPLKQRDPKVGKSELRLWDFESKRKPPLIPGHDHVVVAVAVHPTQPIFLTASSDGTVKEWGLPGDMYEEVANLP